MSAGRPDSTNDTVGNHRRLVKVSIPAPFVQRVVSIAFDEAVCLVLAMLVLRLLSLPLLFDIEVEREYSWVWGQYVDVRTVVYRPLPLYFALLGVRMCYFVPQWVVFGRSLPNRLSGIRVANARTEKTLSLPRSIWRVMVTHLILTPYSVGAVVIISSLLLQQAKGFRWLEEGQGVHDKLAGSVVLGKQTVSRRHDLEGSYWDLVKE